VAYDQLASPGAAQIKFETIGAMFQRQSEGSQGIFRRKSACAAVS
jgi:hypothetical protein